MPLRSSFGSTYYAIGPSRQPWRPGIKEFPVWGLSALLFALLSAMASVILLIVSDNDPIGTWKYQPTVYLSIASTAANILLTYALFEGVSIAWWSKALRNDTDVNALNRVWAHGNSFSAAIICGRNINVVAIACVLVALSPVNGPLLQRASTIGPAEIHKNRTLELQVARLVPQYYTGLVSDRAEEVNMLRHNFSSIATDYYRRSKISLKSACEGICSTSVLGAGFHVNCSSYQLPYNITEAVVESSEQEPIVFGNSVAYNVYFNPVACTINTQIKSKAGCVGELTVRNCTLTGGTVEYPIQIDGPSATVSLMSGSSIWDDTIIGPPDILPQEDVLTTYTTYGGLFLALANQYTSSLQLEWGGAIGYEFYGQESQASLAYTRGIESGASCDVYFLDPMADFLEGARELIFRTAIASANSSNIQSVQALESGSHTVYHSSYLFMGLATLATVVAAFSVLLTFNGFWLIGRSVSMSPIETAKAFNAPILRSTDSNAPVRSLLNEVGTRPVKYGVVAEGPRWVGPDTELEVMSGEEVRGFRLELADPRFVSDIQIGDTYKG